MIQSASTEILRRVHTEDGYIEIGEHSDFPDCLELRTTGEHAEYFGKINLSMNADLAMQLGTALIQAASEKGAKR